MNTKDYQTEARPFPHLLDITTLPIGRFLLKSGHRAVVQFSVEISERMRNRSDSEFAMS